jgi:hypothetical protein
LIVPMAPMEQWPDRELKLELLLRIIFDRIGLSASLPVFPD